MRLILARMQIVDRTVSGMNTSDTYHTITPPMYCVTVLDDELQTRGCRQGTNNLQRENLY